MNWVEQVRRRQRARRLRFFVWMTLALLTQTAAMLLAYGVTRFVLGMDLSPPHILWGVTTISTIIFAIFAKLVPPLPFKGAAPEEAAAEAFFSGKDVRSDDNKFEKDLTP